MARYGQPDPLNRAHAPGSSSSSVSLTPSLRLAPLVPTVQATCVFVRVRACVCLCVRVHVSVFGSVSHLTPIPLGCLLRPVEPEERRRRHRGCRKRREN